MKKTQINPQVESPNETDRTLRRVQGSYMKAQNVPENYQTNRAMENGRNINQQSSQGSNAELQNVTENLQTPNEEEHVDAGNSNTTQNFLPIYTWKKSECGILY